MGRGNQFRGTGGLLHVSHRCHNREFLLKFARDRDAYRALLRQHLKHTDVHLLEYCLTSNHVHLLLDTPEREQMSLLMQELAGEFSRAYNRRKGRMNAYWGDNYHATAVEAGQARSHRIETRTIADRLATNLTHESDRIRADKFERNIPPDIRARKLED